MQTESSNEIRGMDDGRQHNNGESGITVNDPVFPENLSFSLCPVKLTKRKKKLQLVPPP